MANHLTYEFNYLNKPFFSKFLRRLIFLSIVIVFPLLVSAIINDWILAYSITLVLLLFLKRIFKNDLLLIKSFIFRLFNIKGNYNNSLLELTGRINFLESQLSEKLKQELLAKRQELAHEFINTWKQEELLNTFKIELAKSLNEFVVNTQHIENRKNIRLINGLDLQKIFNESSNTTLFLQRMCFSQKEFYILNRYISNLIIEKNCTVRILLALPTKATIESRIDESYRHSVKVEKFGIGKLAMLLVQQAQALKKINESLPSDKASNLQVKLSYDLEVPTAMTGYNDVIIAGLYMNDEVTEEGVQVMAKGTNSIFYQEWFYKFTECWGEAAAINDVNLNTIKLETDQ